MRLLGLRRERGTLPLPPREMQALVGDPGESMFDNPGGELVFPEVPVDRYDSVFDFGCGCGRVARQLIQQRPRPHRYVGIDLHRGMIDWCRRNLAPHAAGFEFRHHDVFNPGLNPGCRPPTAPFPAEEGSVTLLLALSVFTHLTPPQVKHYLRETARVLAADGVARTTWFFFDKRQFPMMQDFQNALYINETDPTNAVIYDRDWTRSLLREVGLTPVDVRPPAVRGFQWVVTLSPARAGLEEADFPPDDAPLGSLPPPLSARDPHRIGLEGD